MPVPPLLGFSTGHFILLFPLLAALPTLFLELQLSILSLSRFGSISPPNHLCSTQPYGKTSSRFLRSGIMEGLEAGQKRYRRPKSTKRSNPEPRDDTVVPPISGSGISCVPATLSGPSPPFLIGLYQEGQFGCGVVVWWVIDQIPRYLMHIHRQADPCRRASPKCARL
jgi:hypothetical protein